MAEPGLLEKLVTDLRARPITIRDDRGDTSGTMTQGSAVALAQAVLGIVRQHDEARGRKRDDDPKPWIADTEIAIISRTVTDLDVIDDGESAGQTHGAIWRVLSYLASRYGYVLATED